MNFGGKKELMLRSIAFTAGIEYYHYIYCDYYICLIQPTEGVASKFSETYG